MELLFGLLAALAIAAASGLVGFKLGERKGLGSDGFYLGLLLGPFGWVITIVSRGNRSECKACRELIHPLATICPYCRSEQPKELAEASQSTTPGPVQDRAVCPTCGTEGPALNQDGSTPAWVCPKCAATDATAKACQRCNGRSDVKPFRRKGNDQVLWLCPQCVSSFGK